jgi:hypothetical protein
MNPREEAKNKRLPRVGLLGGLALVVSFFLASDDTAEALKKRPVGPDKGSCVCRCGSNEKNASGDPKWSGSGSMGNNVTNAACQRNFNKPCVVMSPYGLKNGKRDDCTWTNNDTSLNAPAVSKPGERSEEIEQQPAPKRPKHAPLEKPSGGKGN